MPPSPAQGMSFIGFAAGDWWYHNRAHSDFQLLLRLARDHKVLLVNSTGMRMPVPGKTSRVGYKIIRKLKSVARLLHLPEPDLPNFYVFSPLPLPFYTSRTGRALSAWFVRTQVQIAARRCGIENPAVFLTLPTSWPVVEKLSPRLVIYNRSDKHSQFREADTNMLVELEHQLFDHADVVLYANTALMAEEQEYTGSRARHLDHGVDVELFDYLNVGDEPEDLKRIPSPRVGFLDNLRSYMIDFSLIRQLAKALPEVQVVLVGDPQDSFDELTGIPNLHLLGTSPTRTSRPTARASTSRWCRIKTTNGSGTAARSSSGSTSHWVSGS